jgi:hypothetical protein
VSDDFFGNLDKKLSEISGKQQAAADQREANRAFSEQAIQDMHPVARKYAARLRERGISALVSGNQTALTFEMRWADGAEHGLSVHPDGETGELKIVRISTDHTDGRTFRSSDGRTYGERDWRLSMFEAALEKEIDAYISAADKHRGIA